MKSIDLKLLWNRAISMNGSVAVWRCPQSKQINFLADFSRAHVTEKINLQQCSFGFAVGPFLNTGGDKTIFLKPDIHFVFENNKIVQGDEKFLCETEKYAAALNCYHWNSDNINNVSGSKSHFIEMVKRGIYDIAEGKFDKVVLARTCDELLPDDFDVVALFSETEKARPNAFVSLVSIPEVGTWLGATPELLIELSEAHFKTVSLAGTQPFAETIELSEAAWRQKEIEEQSMVGRYIVDQFKTIRLRKFIETGPRSVRAGNMIHLKSEYTVDLDDVEFPGLGTVMLDLLHPTSAVCGMPQDAAMQFITANEGFSRELYSGFVGPVNQGGITELYVNIRCMQIWKDHITVYAGAGITHDSVAEDEWRETELKCNTLLDIIRL
jgi:isochorismate synthase